MVLKNPPRWSKITASVFFHVFPFDKNDLSQVLLNPDFVKMLDMAQTLAHQELLGSQSWSKRQWYLLMFKIVMRNQGTRAELIYQLVFVQMLSLQAWNVHDISSSFPTMSIISNHFQPWNLRSFSTKPTPWRPSAVSWSFGHSCLGVTLTYVH